MFLLEEDVKYANSTLPNSSTHNFIASWPSSLRNLNPNLAWHIPCNPTIVGGTTFIPESPSGFLVHQMMAWFLQDLVLHQSPQHPRPKQEDQPLVVSKPRQKVPWRNLVSQIALLGGTTSTYPIFSNFIQEICRACWLSEARIFVYFWNIYIYITYSVWNICLHATSCLGLAVQPSPSEGADTQ